MMPEFIDVKLRVRKEKLGDLACNLPVYASWIGVDIVRAEEPRPMIKRVPWATRKSHGLSHPQGQLVKAVASGTKTVSGLNSLFNRRLDKTNRIINNLIRKGVMTRGNDGQVELIPFLDNQ